MDLEINERGQPYAFQHLTKEKYIVLRDDYQKDEDAINTDCVKACWEFRNEEKPPYEEFVDTDGKTKWIEYKDGDKIIRNNNDPSLTHDGIPTIETQLMELDKLDMQFKEDLENRNEEDLKRLKEINLALKVKTIILDEMDIDILTDTRQLDSKRRKLYDAKFLAYLNNADEEFITNKFNLVCHETIFRPGVDYSKFPVYR